MPQIQHTAIPALLRLLSIATLLPVVAAFSASASAAVAEGPPAAGDSAKIVLRLPPTIVRTTPLDALHAEARSRAGAEALETLPIDRPADALALMTGVVLDGDAVHVRGGRTGEMRVELEGIGLNEPFRGQALELPLLALEELELVRGGFGADRGGALAGILVPRFHSAGPRWRSRLLWQTAIPGGSPDDRIGGRVSGPLGATGAGVAVSAEARLDDASLPNLRSPQRTRALGLSLGWRARNQVAATLRLAPVRAPERIVVEAIVIRRLLRPFDPMFSLVGYTSPCPDPQCLEPPAFREDANGGLRFSPYNAADHVPVTDIQRQTIVLSTRHEGRRRRWGAALGWSRERRLISLDGNDDVSVLDRARRAEFGFDVANSVDPYHAWTGDVPFYRKSRAEWLEARVEAWQHLNDDNAFGAGAGGTWERVRLRQVDLAFTPGSYDSLRAFTAEAPGAYAWIAGRFAREGLVAHLGLRAEWMTPGPDAGRTLHFGDPRGVWTASPRASATFPIGARTALDASYVRILQAPGREYLHDQRTSNVVPRHPLGNPELDPATAISFEASLRRQLTTALVARGGYFARDLYRQVSARVDPRVPGVRGTALRYASDDAGRAAGLELGIADESNGPVRWSAAYTWMRTEGSESFEDGVPIYPLRSPQPPPVLETPLSWDQSHRFTFAARWSGHGLVAGWSTVAASGFPWTPAGIRTTPADRSATHSRRLPAYSVTDLSLRASLPRRWSGVGCGLEVRNLFDLRGSQRVSLDGYPNPVINTAYDDYAAHRTDTGVGGGAFWNDPDGDGRFGWTRVRDPRLDFAPRTIRLSFQRDW